MVGERATREPEPSALEAAAAVAAAYRVRFAELSVLKTAWKPPSACAGSRPTSGPCSTTRGPKDG
jgi:hypothetical protein